jgi:hypothetical protein
METLPHELTLAIATTMTAADCLAWAQSSPQYAWILKEISLWRHLAARDLKYPENLFDELASSKNPAQLYQDLSTCHHMESMHSTIFLKRCNKQVFPGTPYCQYHCVAHTIRICLKCQQNPANVVDSKIAEFWSRRGLCRDCQSAEWDKLVTTPCRNRPNHRIIVEGPLSGVVIHRVSDQKIVALGREPANPTDMSHTLDGLISLTYEERNIAHNLSLQTTLPTLPTIRLN